MLKAPMPTSTLTPAHRLHKPLLLCSVSLLLLSTSALAQTPATPLPAAPVPSAPIPPASAPANKPATPIFALPPASPDTLKPPPGPAPSSPVEDQFCYAPATGIFAPYPQPSPEAQAALSDYIRLVMHQIETQWPRYVPHVAKNPYKSYTLYLRFAVRPDGSYTEPVVTGTSGRRDFDSHAIDSINAFSSFPTPPPGVTHPVPICIHFESNVDHTDRPKPIDLWPPHPKQP
jgi:TonB family protein